MILENCIAVALMFMIFIFGLGGVLAAIVKNEENKRLRRKIARLNARLAQKTTLENIRVVNQFYKEQENENV